MTRNHDRIWRFSLDLFAVFDDAGRLLAANPAWRRTLGYDENQLLGSSLHDLVEHADLAGLDSLFQLLRQGDPIERSEIRMRRRDGQWRWVSWTFVPQGTEFYATGRDMTEARNALAALAQADARLNAEVQERRRLEDTLQRLQQFEAIGQVTAGVAHDFNNLLSVVHDNTLLLERMAKTRFDTAGTPHLDCIRRAVEGGARVTAQLLAFARRQRLEPQPLNISQTISAVRDLLRSSLGGAIRFITNLRDDIWPVMTDRVQIEMMVLNLVINARDAMPAGGSVTVFTDNVEFTADSACDSPPPGSYVVLGVSDTGSGMSQEIVAKVFEPFFSTKGPDLGSGLGLTQIHTFARQSGGAVAIETALGSGTTVRVYLPRTDATTQQIGPDSVVQKASAALAPLRPEVRTQSEGFDSAL